ncbi:MAG: L-threonylcarbamoyladenylate synthase [Hydrococcus sp. Prado102]|nr:L-threonylcarbamoyladenylate synthase [Hydrococcus sp. Prado102]
MTKVVQSELIANAIAGKVVSFPTDTVPAIATLPEHSALIFAAKKRPQDKPLILMGASEEHLWGYITGTPEEMASWQQVTRHYWPGAMTLVLPASSRLSTAMNPTDPTTIGLRIPDSDIARTILAQTGPLATTSANLSGEPPLETMNAIDAAFPDVLTLDLAELGDTKMGSGLPSTVAKWTGKGWEILRQGSIISNQ